MPTFFVIGAEKCGTTSLHQYLDIHPEIEMSRVKDPHNFCEPSKCFPHPRIDSLDEYVFLFSGGTEIRGESSPTYSQEPLYAVVAARIATAVPDAKFVYLVRDPIERIRSAYLQRLGGRQRPLRIAQVEPSIDEAIGDLRGPANQYLCPSLYMNQIRQYLEHFPKDSILVVDQRDIAVRTPRNAPRDIRLPWS